MSFSQYVEQYCQYIWQYCGKNAKACDKPKKSVTISYFYSCDFVVNNNVFITLSLGFVNVRLNQPNF